MDLPRIWFDRDTLPIQDLAMVQDAAASLRGLGISSGDYSTWAYAHYVRFQNIPFRARITMPRYLPEAVAANA